MMLNLLGNAGGQLALQVPTNQMDSVLASHPVTLIGPEVELVTGIEMKHA
jgi:hypothetical protein